MATTYANLINANGTIYNSATGRGYATPQELATDLGIRPDQIQWGNIKTGPAPTQPRTYENLVNQGGTIVNTSTGQAYSTPQQLARDLNIQPSQINWQAIPTQQVGGGAVDLGHGLVIQPGQTAMFGYDRNQVYINDNGTLKKYEVGDGELPGGLIRAAGEFAPIAQRVAQGVYVLPPTPESKTTGDPKYDQLLKQLEGYLGELQKRGQVLNPNIELTPEQIAEFTKKAEGEINPYYSSQLKLSRESLLRSQGYTTDDILRSEQDLERKYGKQVRTLGEGAADIGFAQSGLRQRDERELAEETQRTIENQRRQLGFQAGTQGMEFAQKYGSQELPQVNLQETPQVVAGESAFKREGRTLPFYSISPSIVEGLVGEQEYQRRGAVRTRASELESAQRTLSGISQQRTLTL